MQLGDRKNEKRKNNNKMPERKEIYSSKKRKIIKSVNVKVSECSGKEKCMKSEMCNGFYANVKNLFCLIEI